MVILLFEIKFNFFFISFYFLQLSRYQHAVVCNDHFNVVQRSIKSDACRLHRTKSIGQLLYDISTHKKMCAFKASSFFPLHCNVKLNQNYNCCTWSVCQRYKSNQYTTTAHELLYMAKKKHSTETRAKKPKSN